MSERYYVIDVHVIRKEVTATNSGFATQVEKKTDSFVKVISHPTVYKRFLEKLDKFLKGVI